MPTVATPDAVIGVIQNLVTDFGLEDQVDANTKFDELDIDSLDAAEMMTEIKKEFDVTVPRTELADATVGDLAKLVIAQQGS